ncbi:MAG: hypothetical protein H0W34_03445 [Pyrinomonadaceae bacterium]|nr:hypothetical protein [Pyrinomonadaceae bacterium]MBA3571033.1 hypothetical protein [Pyrinomonadaceae bacterium]
MLRCKSRHFLCLQTVSDIAHNGFPFSIRRFPFIITLVPFTKRQRIAFILVLAAGLLPPGLFLLTHHCPASGIAFTKERRDLHRLKNRTTLPQASDFDERVALSSLLQPGDDSARWSSSRAARIEGYVVSVASARTELANCYYGRDTHIHIASQPDAPPREHVVLETTPRMEDWARTQGWDWSEETLERQLLGRLVRFEGWLLFDSSHARESENIAPGTPLNWRATAWEIHPVTKIEVIR